MRQAAAATQPPAAAEPHTARKPARSERPSERPARPAPTQAERCSGNAGAPQGAAPINPSSYNYEWNLARLLEWFVDLIQEEPSWKEPYP